jgi:hypothetical protein
MHSTVFTAIARVADERALQVLSMHTEGAGAILLLGDLETSKFEVITIRSDKVFVEKIENEFTYEESRNEPALFHTKAKKVFLDRARDLKYTFPIGFTFTELPREATA